MTSNTFVKNIEHESAIKHVTGRAIYTDDISEPRNLLHAAIGFSPVSKGIIERIDFSEVLNTDGVVDIITDRDIEGQNDVGPIIKGDKIVLEAELFSLDGKQRFYEKKSSKIENAKSLGEEVGKILKVKSNNSYKK